MPVPVAEFLQGGLISADAVEALGEGWMRSPLWHTEQHMWCSYPVLALLHPSGTCDSGAI